ncbi:hypothetical protein LguiA_019939 [Lonicera macranthoides]
MASSPNYGLYTYTSLQPKYFSANLFHLKISIGIRINIGERIPPLTSPLLFCQIFSVSSSKILPKLSWCVHPFFRLYNSHHGDEN